MQQRRLRAAQDDVHIAEMELEQAQRELGSEPRDARLRHAQRASSRSTGSSRSTDELQKRVRRSDHPRAVRRHGRRGHRQDRDAVAPNQAILTVVNLSSLELEIALPEEYAGETCDRHAGHDRVRRRRLCRRRSPRVSPEVVGNQVTARAVPDEQWPPGCKQNQRLTTRLVFESKKNVLKVAARRIRREPAAAAAPTSSTARWPRGAPIALGVVGAQRSAKSSADCAKAIAIVLSDTSPFGNAKQCILAMTGEQPHARDEKHQEDLPHRPRRDARAARLLAQRRGGRVRRRHGPVGLGQDHVPQRRRPARHLRAAAPTSSTARTSAASPTARCRASATRRSASSSRAST